MSNAKPEHLSGSAAQRLQLEPDQTVTPQIGLGDTDDPDGIPSLDMTRGNWLIPKHGEEPVTFRAPEHGDGPTSSEDLVEQLALDEISPSRDNRLRTSRRRTPGQQHAQRRQDERAAPQVQGHD